MKIGRELKSKEILIISTNKIAVYVLLSFGCCASFFIFSSVTPIKISFVLFLFLFSRSIVKNILNYRFNCVDLCLILYFFWTLITILWSPDKVISINYFTSLMICFSFYFILKSCVFRNEREIFIFFYAMTFVILLSCFFGALQAIAGVGFMPGTDARSVMTGGSFRANGFFFDPNYFSLTLCTAWPLLFVFIKNKRLVVLFSAIIIATLMMTLSRAAIIVLILQIMAISILSLKLNIINIAKIIFATLFVFFAIFVAIYTNLFGIGERVYSIFSYFINNEFSDNSFAERFDLLQAGWNMFSDHILKGVGFGGFEYYSSQYMIFEPRSVVAHNTFLTVASEQGIIGFTIFSFIFYLSCCGHIQNRKKFIFASILGICGNMFFLVAHYMPFVYSFLAIIGSLSGFSTEKSRIRHVAI